jgi:PAS domain S-box-containing protein
MKSVGRPESGSERPAAQRHKRATAHRHKQAAALLGQSEGLWEWELPTGAATFSPRFAQLLGLAAEELPPCQSAFFARLHADDLPRARAALQAHFTLRAPLDLELRLATGSGEYRWFRVRGQAEFGRGGQPVYLASTIADISDRKALEQALQLRDQAIETISQGILIADARSPDQPVVYVSPAFERLTGYSAAELLGRNCRLLQGKDTDPGAVAIIREAIQQQRSCRVELLNYRKDQTPFWNALTIAPITEMGPSGERVTHFIGIQTDVTERRSLEAQFWQAQKMEAIGRLAGGIAHDFNNLLTVINGYSDVLLAELCPSAPQHGPLLEIRSAGQRAAALTAQLLALSRKTLVKPTVVDLNAALQTLSQLLGRLLGEKIALTTSLQPGLARIKIDPGQLDQVIMNLALNARDAMPQGGQLRIETQDLTLRTKDALSYPDCRPGPYVRLVVADTGCGMTDEVKAKLFEPFFTTKEQGKGTGLGLATVYGIIKQAGGQLGVSSQVDCGTRFTLLFPAVRDRVGRSVVPRQRPPRSGSETILLIEDEPALRRLARRVLEAKGYTVLEAQDGAAALQLCEQHKGAIDLLLTDVVMPGLSAREVVAALCARRPGLKVLYMSGYTSDATLRERVSGATSAFLPKPFSGQELATKVRAVLDEALPPAS